MFSNHFKVYGGDDRHHRSPVDRRLLRDMVRQVNVEKNQKNTFENKLGSLLKKKN